MKQPFLFLASGMLAAAAASCSSEDGPKLIIDPVMGLGIHNAFILNQGDYYNRVDGALNVVTETGSLLENVFDRANGRTLGATPQCGVAYGTKIYIGTFESNTIEILDGANYKSLKQHILENSTSGTQPRSMVCYKGKVYVSMFDGYVARIDTTTLEIEASVKVGPNPEGMCVYKDKLYVPNSDGLNWMVAYGETASVIDFETFKVEKEIKVPLNPKQFMTDGKDLYLLSLGNYGDVESVVSVMEKDGSFRKIGLATLACMAPDEIYLLNAPYSTKPTYSKYTISKGELKAIDFPGVECPGGIGYDSWLNKLVVTSMPVNDGWKAQYMLPGKAIVYDMNLTQQKSYAIGSGPACIFFNEN